MAEVKDRSIHRVCVVLPAATKDHSGIGAMLAGILCDLGLEAETARDARARASQADLALLIGIGSSYDFAGTLERLRGKGRAGPKVALWHVEPLPPPGLTEQAEEIGIRLTRLNWSKLPLHLGQVVRRLPGQNWIRDGLRRRLTSRFVEEMTAHGGAGWDRLHHRQLYYAMEHYLWIQRWWSQGRLDHIFVSTPARYHLLGSRGIACEFVPIGYHASWGRDLQIERDIDVVFIGRVAKTARPGVLRKVERELTSRRIKLVRVEKGCYGEQRTRLLSRAKIVLDITKVPWEMPLMRLLMSMSCGALVVTNWTDDPAPFEAKHLVQAEPGKLADSIEHYLRHREQREEIAAAARRFVTTELTMASSLSRIVSAVQPEATRQTPVQCEVNG